jgi:hypothetical protein
MTRLTGLTGRVRVRTHRRWFRPALLIPQVETVSRASGPDGEQSVRRWRDMRTDDLVAGLRLEVK